MDTTSAADENIHEKNIFDTQVLLTEGNLWKAIWVMSWPLMLATFSASIVGLVDVQCAGLLGSLSQAAMGLCEQVIFMFMVFLMSMGVGTTAIVSRAFGAADVEASAHATAQSLALSVITGLFLTVIALVAGRYALPLYNADPEVIRQAQIVFGIFGFYLIPFSLWVITTAAFRAIGDTKTPLIVGLIMTCLNIAGDYLTVVAHWPVPNLGIKGIVYSAIFADSVGAAIILWRLRLSPLKGCFRKFWPFSGDEMMRVVRIGVPSALQRLSFCFSSFALFLVLGRCENPTQALASWTIGMRVESLIFMPLMALSMAVSSIVGQSLGAKQKDRAIQAGWQVTWVGIGLMMILAIVLWVFARPLAAFMSHDPKAIEYTVSYIRINCLSEPFLAVNWVLSGALQGAGDSRLPMWVSIFHNWMIRLPLAYYLAIYLNMGPNGAWIAMTTSVVVSAILIAWRYQSGKWIETKV